jgi:hypothetical protein
VFEFYAVGRAGVGAFIRDLVKSMSSAGAERAYGSEETRDSIVVRHVEPPVVVAAAEPAPQRPIRPQRSARLIDLERRAKFRRFDSSR